MSESSPEKTVEEPEVDKTAEPEAEESKQGLVKAIGKARGDKRAAQEEVEKLKQEKAARAELDDVVMDQLVAQAKKLTTEAVAEQLAPEREARAAAEAENALLRMRMDHGLNDEQAGKVMELAAEKKLGVEDALVLSQKHHPELFPTPSTTLGMGGLPTAGNSLARGVSSKEDFKKMSDEAWDKGNPGDATRFAALELQRRFRRAFNRP